MKEVPIPTPSGLAAGDSIVKKWAVAARVPFLTASVMPVLVATAACWRATGRLEHPWHALLAIVGVALIQAGANLANDYFDHLSGDDPANRLSTPFSGGSRVIQEGIVSARAVLAAALACLGAGSACGILLWLRTGHTLLVIGLVGMAIAWFYTAPPLRLVHRGLGELALGIAFGPLPVLGAQYVQSHELTLAVGWLGLPAGLLVVAILEINEFPDVAADASVGKRTIVVRLGLRGGVALYEALVLGAYAAVAVGIARGWLPPLAALVILVAPLSWKAIRVLRAHPDDVRALVPAMAATIGQHAAFLLLLTGACLADLALHAR